MNKIMLNKMPISILAILVMFVSLLAALPAHAIKKCKDAEGRWHYGDVAVRECQDSKVTTLSNQGFVRDEKPAVKTKEELLADEKAEEKAKIEKERIAYEEREKFRILTGYETEADIDRQRDNQLYSIDSNIAVHNSFLQSMNEVIAHEEKKLVKATNPVIKKRIEEKIVEAKKNLALYSDEVVALKSDRQGIVDKFEAEKLLYREFSEDADGQK